MLGIDTRYTCDRCTSTRTLNLKLDEISHQIYEPEDSTNGLIVYSDIHRCENGILGINNLHIDRNNAVRSLEYLTLPDEKIRRRTMEGIPSPNLNISKFKTVRVTGMMRENSFRLRILDKDLKIELFIGDVKEDKEEPIASLTSAGKGITLDYYESSIELTDNVESWMVELINLLEVLPPTKIGLFIETLRYIHGLTKIGPAKFHLDMLKTILSSHKIYFDLVESKPNFQKLYTGGEEKYGEDALNLMIKLLAFIEYNPKTSLQEYTKTHNEDISHLIYMFLLLEQENLIHIYRPDLTRITRSSD